MHGYSLTIKSEGSMPCCVPCGVQGTVVLCINRGHTPPALMELLILIKHMLKHLTYWGLNKVCAGMEWYVLLWPCGMPCMKHFSPASELTSDMRAVGLLI